MTFADILGLPEDDVEDVFARDIYVQLVNGALNLKGCNALTTRKLDDSAAGASRLLKQTENACKLLPPDVAEFDHYSPADWLARNPHILDGEDENTLETLSRAEKVFGVLNSKLPAE